MRSSVKCSNSVQCIKFELLNVQQSTLESVKTSVLRWGLEGSGNGGMSGSGSRGMSGSGGMSLSRVTSGSRGETESGRGVEVVVGVGGRSGSGKAKWEWECEVGGINGSGAK